MASSQAQSIEHWRRKGLLIASPFCCSEWRVTFFKQAFHSLEFNFILWFNEVPANEEIHFQRFVNAL